jgi:hypothetical protein
MRASASGALLAASLVFLASCQRPEPSGPAPSTKAPRAKPEPQAVAKSERLAVHVKNMKKELNLT